MVNPEEEQARWRQVQERVVVWSFLALFCLAFWSMVFQWIAS